MVFTSFGLPHISAQAGRASSSAHSKFPKKFFDARERVPGELERGDIRSLTAVVDGERVAAHCWFDNKPKQIVATFSTTDDGEPHGKKRWRNNDDGTSTGFIKYVKRPRVIQDYFDAAAVIDIDNHYRQSGLALEDAWGTQRWDHRVASTLIGMCEVDAFLAYSRFEGHDAAKMTHGEFTERLALQLIRNTFPGHETAVTPARASSSPVATPARHRPGRAAVDVGDGESHILATIKSQQSSSPSKPRNGGKGGGRKNNSLACSVCRSPGACYYCTDCSDLSAGRIVPICGPHGKSGTKCFCAVPRAIRREM